MGENVWIVWGSISQLKHQISQKREETLIYSQKPIAYIDNSHINFVYMCVYILYLYINNAMKCREGKDEQTSNKQWKIKDENKTILGKRDGLEWGT